MVTMRERVAEERLEESVSRCRHHWLIDVAGGPTSKGVCRLCGTERQFRNYLDSTEWEREPALPEPVRLVGSSVGSIEESEEED